MFQNNVKALIEPDAESNVVIGKLCLHLLPNLVGDILDDHFLGELWLPDWPLHDHAASTVLPGTRYPTLLR